MYVGERAEMGQVVQRNDPKALKPLKVRLPLGHVLQLHRMRIMGDRSVSQIVEQALEDYLNGLQQEAKSAKPPADG